VPADPFATQPVATSLLLAALAIATYLYGALLRRRHAQERARESSLNAIVDNYGRDGLP
jgi:hypothetical protein